MKKIKLTEEEIKKIKAYQYQCLNHAVNSGLLNYKELGVYVLINQLFNHEYGYAFPSHEYIKNKLNISEPTLIKILNSIEEKGYIKRKKGKTGYNTHYYLTMPS